MSYDDAISLARENLSKLDPECVTKACGVPYEDWDYHVPWFNMKIKLSDATDTLKILWLHYLTANGAKEPKGRLIAYREAAPALFYEPNFYKRAVMPIVKYFGKRADKLIAAGRSLGGSEAGVGDASVCARALPYLPVTFVIWEGSDEFPPEGNILFDITCKTWFGAEDLAVLASCAAYELIGAGKRIPDGEGTAGAP